MLQQPRVIRRVNARVSIAGLGVSAVLLFAACGSDSTAAAKQQVATLGSLATSDTTASSISSADTQAALLAYAACMRENGIDMADPTFDANGDPTGGLFGPDSGINQGAEGFQEAQTACGSLIEGITLGGRGGGTGIDRDAVQASLNDFTACLRDNGLTVDDIEFGNGQGPGAGGGGFGGGTPPDGSIPAGATPADGSVPAGGGGFGGPPGTGDGTGGGFDPTDRIIDQLGLDAEDPTVVTALAACQSILDGAFQQTTTTTTG